MYNDEKNSNSAWVFVFIAWIIATVATLGSLFFSEVMGFPPCTLCWYQRICMYPLVFILMSGMIPFDRNVIKYAFPLVGLGWFFAFYHNLIHYEIIPESASPCAQGVPCSVKYIEIFDIFTIPMLSLIAFSAIGILLIKIKRKIK